MTCAQQGYLFNEPADLCVLMSPLEAVFHEDKGLTSNNSKEHLSTVESGGCDSVGGTLL